MSAGTSERITPTDITMQPVNSPVKGSLLQVTLSPAAVGAATTAEQNVTVTGLKTTDLVFIGPYTCATAVGLCGARVSAADTLTLRFVNPTAGSVTPTASQTYTFLVVRTA